MGLTFSKVEKEGIMVSESKILCRDEVQQILCESLRAACANITEETVIGNDMTWSKLGLDSLDYVDVASRVNLVLPDLKAVSPQWSLKHVGTVGEAVSYIFALYLSQIGRDDILQIIKDSLMQIDRLLNSEIDALTDSYQLINQSVGEYDSSDVVELAVFVQRRFKITESSFILSTSWGAKGIADMINEVQAKIAAQLEIFRATLRSLP